MRWQIIVPNVHQLWWPCRQCRCRASHKYVVYVSLHGRNDWFAMPAMFRTSAAEVWWLLIISCDSGGPKDGTFASQALPHLLIRGFLHSTWVGIGLGRLFNASALSIGKKKYSKIQESYLSRPKKGMIRHLASVAVSRGLIIPRHSNRIIVSLCRVKSILHLL